MYPGGEDVVKYYQDYLDRDPRGLEGGRPARREAVPRAEVGVRRLERAEGGGGRRGAEVPANPAREGGAWPPSVRERVSSRPVARAQDCAQDAGGGTFSLTAAKRVVLPNGMTVILLEDHRLPVVVGTAEVRDVLLREPAEKSGVAATHRIALR